jgi:hypothetical protein
MESKTGCVIHTLDLKQYVTIWASHEGAGGEEERQYIKCLFVSRNHHKGLCFPHT